MNTKKICPICGREFAPKRADAKYCSGACNSKAYRERQKSAEKEEDSVEYAENLAVLVTNTLKAIRECVLHRSMPVRYIQWYYAHGNKAVEVVASMVHQDNRLSDMFSLTTAPATFEDCISSVQTNIPDYKFPFFSDVVISRVGVPVTNGATIRTLLRTFF